MHVSDEQRSVHHDRLFSAKTKSWKSWLKFEKSIGQDQGLSEMANEEYENQVLHEDGT